MFRKFLKTVGNISRQIKPQEGRLRKRLAERLVNMRKKCPYEHVLEITTRCNHFCKMCTFKHKEKTNRGDMSFEIYKKIIKEIPSNYESLIEFAGGGEPLMHKEFIDFLIYGKKALPKSRFFLITNGSILYAEMGQKLIDLELDYLNLGLNSSTPEGHRWLTNADDFEKIVDNGINFLKMKNRNGFRKPLTFVQILECEELAHEIEGFKIFWEPIADRTLVRHVIAGMDGGVLKSEKITQIYSLADRRYPCALPFRDMTFGANGDIFPCNTFSHEGIPLGNIEKNTIQEVWQGDKIIDLRRSHLENRFHEIATCKDCDMWGYFDNFWIRNFLKIGKRQWW